MSIDEFFEMAGEQEMDTSDLERHLEVVPETVDEFEDQYEGDVERLLGTLGEEMGEDVTASIGYRERHLFEAAMALELASRGRTPDELVELVEKFDEAGLEYEGHTKMGAAMKEPVEALGGEDWTRFTYSFDDWASHEAAQGFCPTMYVNAFHNPAIEASVSVDVQNDADLFEQLYGEIVERNLADDPYFELKKSRDNLQDSPTTHLYFGKLRIPSPFPELFQEDTDYDREQALESMNAFRDTISQIAEATHRMEELRADYRERLESVVSEYVDNLE